MTASIILDRPAPPPRDATPEDVIAGTMVGGGPDSLNLEERLLSPESGCSVTFSISGVVDSGGIKRVDWYSSTDVPPVTPEYTWELTVPPDYPAPLPPLSGSGASTSVAATVGAVPILGPGVTTFTLPENAGHNVDLLALRAGDMTLGVEGLEFAAEVKLKVELLDDTGQPAGGEDEIQLKVAPFVMLPNTATASKVLVANQDLGFWGDIAALVGTENVMTTTAGVDVWTQDAWEFGFSIQPGSGGLPQVMPVALETLRAGRPLQPWGRQNLLGPVPGDGNRAGLIPRQQEADDVLSYGGNLELLPPYNGYPLGRIVVGTMPEAQKAFLERQGMQGPLVELDTSWLRVGHIDELMAVVPWPNVSV